MGKCARNGEKSADATGRWLMESSGCRQDEFLMPQSEPAAARAALKWPQL